MKVEISVIVPCLNEEKNLNTLVRRIQNVFNKEKVKGEIILVDDGSTDRTYEIINEQRKRYKNIVGVRHSKNKGIVQGWKNGLNVSNGKYIVIIDADLQYQPEDISRLYHAIISSHYDIVQGHRTTVYGGDPRYFLSKALNFILNTLFSMNLKDNKSGFIICKKIVFRDILSYKYPYNFFQHFIMVSANKKGYKIKQIPVQFAKRKKGKSFIKILPVKFTLKASVDIPKAYREFKK